MAKLTTDWEWKNKKRKCQEDVALSLSYTMKLCHYTTKFITRGHLVWWSEQSLINPVDMYQWFISPQHLRISVSCSTK